jgi:hypothetical protein
LVRLAGANADYRADYKDKCREAKIDSHNPSGAEHCIRMFSLGKGF